MKLYPYTTSSSVGRVPSRGGFTLIEILAAMGILVLIILLLSRLFTESTRIWSSGTARVYQSQEGRVVMDFLVKEVSQAIGDDVVSFKIHSASGTDNFSVPAYGLESDSICFVGPTRTPPVRNMLRACPHAVYFVANMLDENEDVIPNRFRLARVRKTGSVHSSDQNLQNSAHGRPDWWRRTLWSFELSRPARIETVAENIAGFEVWAYSEDTGAYVFDYDSTTQDNKLPLWVDIYLEMLDEKAAIQLADIMAGSPTLSAEAADFMDRNMRRYTARIHFRNREGYSR
jgi:prepilin-type N-terminal cleavage/methylation domain-containing protein